MCLLNIYCLLCTIAGNVESSVPLMLANDDDDDDDDRSTSNATRYYYQQCMHCFHLCLINDVVFCI